MKIRDGLILFVSVVSNVACAGSVISDSGLSNGDVEDASLPSVDTPNSLDIPTQVTDVGGCLADGSSCGPGCANCGAGCVNTESDNMNCGGCGTICGAGRSCQSGRCACAPGNVMCGAQCINTMTDSMNCGMCGRACPMGQTCNAGTCQLNCEMPSALCTVNGVTSCINVQTDPMNCGGCGTACMSANANAVCGMGRCALGTCLPGFGNCDRQAGNGCEINTNTDVANCGGCDNACPPPPNAAASCLMGACGVGACNPGFGNCDGNAANGCETNTNTAATNCGACGNLCPTPQNGSASCIAGVCGVGSCNFGFGNCDGNARNGCETDTGTSATSCGVCGNVCPAPANGAPVCRGGVCGVGSCNAGFANCDGNGANGCEINTMTSATHCGACGNSCPAPPNVRPVCVDGVCGLGSCNAGFANCDGQNANGCEVNTQDDANNCGGCGSRCPAGQACVAGACIVRPGPAYNPVGPQQNVSVATVTNGGWTQCHLEAYNANTPIAMIQAACNRTNVMLACRLTNNPTLQLLAQAPRVDVFFDTGDDLANRFNVHNANGSAWYFSTSWSMGFARQGDVVNRYSCDYPDAMMAPGSTLNPELRMCIHTARNSTGGGFRCGADLALYGATYERIFYHAN